LEEKRKAENTPIPVIVIGDDVDDDGIIDGVRYIPSDVNMNDTPTDICPFHKRYTNGVCAYYHGGTCFK
jgi:hypothetical protein